MRVQSLRVPTTVLASRAEFQGDYDITPYSRPGLPVANSVCHIDSKIAPVFLRALRRIEFCEKDNPEYRFGYLDDMIAVIF